MDFCPLIAPPLCKKFARTLQKLATDSPPGIALVITYCHGSADTNQ